MNREWKVRYLLPQRLAPLQGSLPWLGDLPEGRKVARESRLGFLRRCSQSFLPLAR